MFLAENQGITLAGSQAATAHHDQYEIAVVFKDLFNLLHEAGIPTEGLFLTEAYIVFNPGNGKAENYIYFDEKLFKRRNVKQASQCLVRQL